MRGPSEGCTSPLTDGCGRQTWLSGLQAGESPDYCALFVFLPCFLVSAVRL